MLSFHNLIYNNVLRPIEFHLPIVSSTNDYAKELLVSYPYVLVTAQHQTAGRGRKGRAWHGDYGANIYASVGIRHSGDVTTDELSAYMGRGAQSVLRVLRKHSPNAFFRLKYPNDVQAKTEQGWAKIAGVLVEHEFQGSRCTSTVVGLGINVEQRVFPDNITQPCTSLRLLDVGVAVSSLLNDLRDVMAELMTRPWFDVHETWVQELDMGSKDIRIAETEGTWKFVRIASDGRLIVRNVVTQMERTVTDGDTVRYQD
ncbi:MAG: biotin--[acetyl-CoA-carboxylase] ligase [bacterium]|nr:biotin--[acetyl-CoA-carboxylase] ligase [bacterium]